MPSNIKGITVELGGNTGPLTTALKDVNKVSRDLNDELKHINKALKLDPTNTVLLGQKQKVLAAQIANTKEKLDRLKEAERQAKAQFENGDMGEEKYRAVQREVIATEQELKRLENQAKQAAGAMGEHIQETGKQMQKSGEHIADVGKKFLPVTAAVIGVGAASVKTGNDFEKQMSRVAGIADATGDDLDALKEQAKQLGSDTAYSATEAAEGMENLASAGFGTQEIMAAMPGMLDLAASSGEDLASSADVAASTLRGFGLAAADAGHVADVLAKNAADTNAAVMDTGEAMKYVAPVAKNAGWSLESVTAAIGAMADAGIKGSQAGTVLRGAITRLMKPSKNAADAMKSIGFNAYDSSDKMKPMSVIVDELKTKTSKLSDKQRDNVIATIMGQEALSGMNVLMDAGKPKLDKLTTGLEHSDGAAKKMAKTMQDNTAGSVEQMQGAMESAAISIQEALAPTMIELVKKITELVDKFNSLDKGAQKTILKLIGIAGVIGPVIIGIGKMKTGIGVLVEGFGKLVSHSAGAASAATGVASSMTGLGSAMGALPIIGIIAGIAALTAGGIALYKHLSEDSIPAVDLFGDKVSESTQKAVKGYMKLDDEATTSLNRLKWSGETVTAKMAKNIGGNFETMKNQIITSLNDQATKTETTLTDMFAKSTTMTDEEKTKILTLTQTKHDEQVRIEEDGAVKIKTILDTAASQNRALKTEEVNYIITQQEQMRRSAVQTMSDGAAEQAAIMEGLRAESGKISARQAAETVKNSREQKEKTIQEADEEYRKRLKAAALLRADGSKESEEMADKIVAEATKQHTKSVSEAEGMHKDVVAQAKAQAGEHVSQVNWETGEVKSKGEVMRDTIVRKSKETWDYVCRGMKAQRTELGREAEELGEAIKTGWSDRTSKAYEWGKDLVTNIGKGINSMRRRLKSAAETVGEVVKRVLGHSVPKEGPLKDELAWMPDMMENLAKGIEKNKSKVQDAITGMAEDMTAEIPVNIKTTERVQAAAAVSGSEAKMIPVPGATQDLKPVVALLQNCLSQLSGMQVVLDSGAVVGGLAPEMDAEFGNLHAGRARGRL